MKINNTNLILGIGAVALCTSCNGSKQKAIQNRPDFEKPNIIYFLADDMSYFDISALGQKEFSTPNIDKLLQEGIFFQEAYSGSPESGPSRACLMTGKHPGHCRIRNNDSYRGQEYFEENDTTMAEMLKLAGYTTGMFGKWGNGTPGTPGTPEKQGFDYSIGFYDQLRAHTFYPNYLMENGEVLPLPQNYGFDMEETYRHSTTPEGLHVYDAKGKLIPKGIKDPDKAVYSQNLIQEKALEFIKKNKDKPFFLYYPTQLPHGPVITPSIAKFMDKPWPMKQKEWAAMMEMLDTHIGQVLALLEELNLRENTLIFFSSDNGYSHWGYMGRKPFEDDPIFKNKGPWDSGKFVAKDGGSRVPFLANWPKVIQPGRISNHLVSLCDIYATVCDVAEVKPNEIDGRSLLPILAGTQPEGEKLHDYLYWEGGSFTPVMQSVRCDNWFAYRKNYTDSVHVFDLTTDIHCDRNIASQHPERVKRALEIFAKEHVPSKWYQNPEDTEEVKKQKREAAKTDFIKQTKGNIRRPQNKEELLKMIQEQKTRTLSY